MQKCHTAAYVQARIQQHHKGNSSAGHVQPLSKVDTAHAQKVVAKHLETRLAPFGGKCSQKLNWFKWQAPWNGKNVGDDINVPLAAAVLRLSEKELKMQRCTLCRSFSNNSKLLVVGSVVNAVRSGDVVAGSGWNFKMPVPTSVTQHRRLRNVTWAAIRGPLTRKFLKKYVADESLLDAAATGDPALFAHMLLPEWKELRVVASGRERLCIVPHASDNALKRVLDNVTTETWRVRSTNVTVIKTDLSPRAFAMRLCSCGLVASSSLHGIVLADSMRVPAVWLRHNYTGGAFNEDPRKYYDYFAGIERPVESVESVEAAAMYVGRVRPRFSTSELCDLTLRWVSAFPYSAVCEKS
mmetsp:Transcript_13214/g.21972  ORF Transcript_13214/g.21972 Transcript_13214/m.21972 type:complete len:354 (+) Transcript_13214:102-1163(+)